MLQSVLVTIDRHEWYAPPQIYKRDDSSGLWTVKLALPPESPLLFSGIHPGKQDLSNHSVSSCATEVSAMDLRPQQVSQESMDGVTNTETSCDSATEGLNIQDDSDAGTKKRRVEENLSADGDVLIGRSLNGHREERFDDSVAVEDAALRDYQGAAPVANNASVAERAIEPTLVMFEVTLVLIYACFLCYLFYRSGILFPKQFHITNNGLYGLLGYQYLEIIPFIKPCFEYPVFGSFFCFCIINLRLSNAVRVYYCYLIHMQLQ